MHRSHSSTRVADEYYRNLSSAISSSSAPSGGGGEGDGDGDGQLPLYSPVSDVAKKEKSRLRSAENAVHLIPLVLVLCAVILWFSSNPGNTSQKSQIRLDRSSIASMSWFEICQVSVSFNLFDPMSFEMFFLILFFWVFCFLSEWVRFIHLFYILHLLCFLQCCSFIALNSSFLTN